MSGSCSEELDDDEPCSGAVAECPLLSPSTPPITGLGFGTSAARPNPYGGGGGHHHQYSSDAEECALQEWSDWSPCSNPCGYGRMTRTRLYKIPFVEDRSCQVRMIDTQQCFGAGTARECIEMGDEAYADPGMGAGSSSSYGYADYRAGDGAETYPSYDFGTLILI